ncbi:MAG: hypothetical protein GY926_18040, partial [bacterium]|nr:hypothetical protein [bacterium]
KIQVNGSDASSFTGTQLTAGQVTFIHDGSETVAASFDVNVEDGNEDVSAPANSTFNFTVTPVDDNAPTAVNQSTTVSEGATNIALTTVDLSSTDVDTDDTMLIYTVADVNNGTLTINGSAWASGTNDTFTQQDVIDGNVLYTHDGTNTSSDSFAYTVEDPTGNTLAGQTFSITVTAVNDAPVNTIPGLQSIPEDTALTFSTAGGNAVSVADDAGAGDIIKVTLSIRDNASLTLTRISGASVTGWSVTPGTVNWVLEGTVAQINAEMDGMIFTPGGDFVGMTSLRITTEDQGNTGLGGAPTDTDTITITVTPVNDAPVLTGDLSANINE